jgi:hypothetical protein
MNTNKTNNQKQIETKITIIESIVKSYKTLLENKSIFEGMKSLIRSDYQEFLRSTKNINTIDLNYELTTLKLHVVENNK